MVKNIKPNMHQLEFISVSKDGNIMVGSSNLINSSNWTGHLWYFDNESNLVSGHINDNEKYLEYPLPLGIAAGTFLDSSKMLVGNDVGLIAVYGVDRVARDDSSETNMAIYNKIARTEHDRSVLSLSVSKTAQNFVSSSMDRSVKLWDTETFMPVISYDKVHTGYVTFVSFMNSEADDDHVFVSASFDGSLLLWDRRKSNPVQVLMEEEDYRPTHVEWFDDAQNVFYVGCDYGTIRSIDIRNPKKAIFVHEFSRGRSVNTLRSYVHNSIKYLSVCGNMKTLKIYQCAEGLKEVYSNESHSDYIQDTAWLPKTGTLLSCSWDSQLIRHNPFQIGVINSHGDASR